MDVIWGVLNKFQKGNEEDVHDRFFSHYSPLLFAIAFAFTSLSSYFGQQIACWTPNEFKGGWIQYAHAYCYAENTYFWDMNNPDMPSEQYRDDNEIRYYQWVEFILAGLGLLFLVPHFFWSRFNWISGLPVADIIKVAREKRYASEKEQKEAVQKITSTIKRFEEKRKGDASSVAICYFLMKIANLIVVLAEIVILWNLIGFTISEFLAFKIVSNSEWKLNGIFPRQTMCDFQVRTKGNVQKYSIQCVLVQNMTNEIIFVFIFYYLLVVAALTFYSIVLLFKFCASRDSFIDDRRNIVQKLYKDRNSEQNKRNEKSEKDGETSALLPDQPIKLDKLSLDTAIVLRLIENNAGKNMSSDIISELIEY